MVMQPLQTQTCGRMCSGTESNARIQTDIDGVGIGRLMPGRNDPKIAGNLSRCELGLRDANPVIVRNFRSALENWFFKTLFFERSF